MPSPELRLVSEAHRYIEGRSTFEELYLLAGALLPRLIHGPESTRTLAGAILAAEADYRDEDRRRLAVVRALDVKEHASR